VLFLPAVVYRSRLEERALSGKFGGTWEEYTHQTMFLIPFRTYAVE
jgi:protein-S-isoprenylcysteine O-methyltransferase Ste14